MYVYSIRTLLVCVSHFDVTTGLFILYLFIHTYACDIAVKAECTQGAMRHLLQAGQIVEDALRHALQLVVRQHKSPVGMADMS